MFVILYFNCNYDNVYTIVSSKLFLGYFTLSTQLIMFILSFFLWLSPKKSQNFSVLAISLLLKMNQNENLCTEDWITFSLCYFSIEAGTVPLHGKSFLHKSNNRIETFINISDWSCSFIFILPVKFNNYLVF